MNKKIFFALIFLSFIGLASATFTCNDFTSKWNYCGAMNISGVECDNFWINASDCNVTKMNLNSSFNQSDYYSRSQIDSLFANFTSLNITNGTIVINQNNSGNFTDCVTKEELTNATQEVWDNANSKFATRQNFTDLMNGNVLRNDNNNSGSSNNLDPMWVLVAFVGVFLGFYFYNQNKNKKNQSPQIIPKDLDSPEAYQSLIDKLEKEKSKKINSKKRK